MGLRARVGLSTAQVGRPGGVWPWPGPGGEQIALLSHAPDAAWRGRAKARRPNCEWVPRLYPKRRFKIKLSISLFSGNNQRSCWIDLWGGQNHAVAQPLLLLHVHLPNYGKSQRHGARSIFSPVFWLEPGSKPPGNGKMPSNAGARMPRNSRILPCSACR